MSTPAQVEWLYIILFSLPLFGVAGLVIFWVRRPRGYATADEHMYTYEIHQPPRPIGRASAKQTGRAIMAHADPETVAIDRKVDR